MQRNEPEYNTSFLKNSSYQRYRCRICGEYFWSKKPRTTCPDRPCSRYDFLVKDYPGVKPLSLDEARKAFIDYFVENGHGYVEPYPVLARWRDDLYLTIASIIVFQPAVTEGIVEPPHNPLVIVQPCIRLEDIDNVGLTFGRHLSSFEMGGHHAFNKPDKQVYWVEETLQHAYRFFTEKIGVPGEDIVFKESWWEGGGNAGPAYEVLVDGLELATLVFMKYKVVDGKYVDNPVLVVDTGYGIERIAWFTQRTPTAFHAIYGGLVEEYKDILGIEEPDHEVLRKIVYETSNMDFTGLRGFMEYVSRNSEYARYSDALGNAIRLYTLLDHAKTVALMLSDGIVPSNTGEGYLARLVIRRALRTLLLLGVEEHRLGEVFGELLERQIMFWRNRYVYARFEKHAGYIIDVVLHEAEKFRNILRREEKIVKKYLKKRRITVDDLVTIYDSHGIPPEIIADKLREKGVEVEVPENFYSLVASRHTGPVALAKQKEHELVGEVAEWANRFPETERVFHDNPYQRELEATVLGVMGKYVVLDKTIFYPKAGGQENDTGVIEVDRKTVPVVMVYKTRGGVIVHELGERADNLLRPGQRIRCRIDWARRYRLMRHHTATHIILGAARRVLGDHVWQAGAEKTPHKARLDITHYKMLTPDEIRRIEDEANRIIDERIDVRIHYLGKFEAEKRYGIKIYEGGAVVAPVLRIVEIPGWDAEACFGTHVANTSEIGCIKIINVDKIQDGVVRLEYSVATQVPVYARELEDKITWISKERGGGDAVAGVRKLVEERERLRKMIAGYRSYMRELLYREILSMKQEICGYPVVFIEKKLDDDQLYRDIVARVTKEGVLAVYMAGGIIEVFAPRGAGIDLRKGLQSLRSQGHVLKGGGRPEHVTIRLSEGDEPRAVAELLIKAALGCGRH